MLLGWRPSPLGLYASFHSFQLGYVISFKLQVATRLGHKISEDECGAGEYVKHAFLETFLQTSGFPTAFGTSNQKLLGAPGLTTRSKDATRGLLSSPRTEHSYYGFGTSFCNVNCMRFGAKPEKRTSSPLGVWTCERLRGASTFRISVATASTPSGLRRPARCLSDRLDPGESLRVKDATSKAILIASCYY